MNRRIEVKLKRSLDVYLPHDYEKKTNWHFAYTGGIIALIVCLSCLIKPTTLYFNPDIYLSGMTTKMNPLAGEQTVSNLASFPTWNEDVGVNYQYQYDEDTLHITYQKEFTVYLTMKKEELPISSESKGSKIANTTVHLAYQDGIYQAIWQVDDFTVVVQMHSSRNQFIQEINHIIKENLT